MALQKSFQELLDTTPISEISSPANPNTVASINLPGFLTISYSKLALFHVCPRKFLLVSADQKESDASLSTNFGHCFGVGVQSLWETGSLPIALAKAFAHWTFDIDDGEERSSRNLWHCMECISEYFTTKYIPMRNDGWTLYYHMRNDGEYRAGIELTCAIFMHEHFLFQMHIDLVLENVSTGEIRVQEFKTSKFAQSAANWQNSEQTSMYCAVLGAYVRGAEKFKTQYVIASTKANPEPLQEYVFSKSLVDINEIITSIDLDVLAIKNYYDVKLFPKRGSACVSFGKVCGFFGTCDYLQDSGLQALEDVFNTETSPETFIKAWETGDSEVLETYPSLKSVDILTTYDTMINNLRNVAEGKLSAGETVYADAAITSVVKGILED